MRQKIIDWMVNNQPVIRDICKPLIDQKLSLYLSYPSEYHDDIQKQCKEAILSNLCNLVCKDLGCSTEQFYETMEGADESWISISLD